MLASAAQLNLSITQSTYVAKQDNKGNVFLSAQVKQLDVTVEINAKAQAMLEKSNVDKLSDINDMLLQNGYQSLQESFDSGLDVSPQATADRIVSFATGGFSGYLARHQDQDLNSNLGQFMDLIKGAIEEGFAEAKDILESLSLLNGEIKENVDQTYTLVQEGLNRFEENILSLE